MPILHVLGKDETSRMLTGSGLQWANRTTERVSYHEIPGDHFSPFHEENPPMICCVIETWLATQLRLQQVNRRKCKRHRRSRASQFAGLPTSMYSQACFPATA